MAFGVITPPSATHPWLGTGLPSNNHGGMGAQPANPQQWAQAKQRSANMAMQTFLKGKGLYQGAIDGIVGPQTRAAQQRWHVVSAQLAAHKGADPNAPAPAAATPPGNVPLPGVVDTSGGAPSSGTGPTPTLASLGLGNVGKGMGSWIMNPTAYAQAATDTQYGPLLAELARQQTQSLHQGSQDQKDIQAWYGALQSDLSNLSSGDASAGQAALGQQDAAEKGLLNVIGGNGGVADSAGAYAAAARSNLAGQVLANDHYDKALAPAYASQRNDALAHQLALDKNTSEQIGAKIADTTAAKGNAQVTNLANAQDQAMKQRMALVNMKSELAMLPYTVQGAKIDTAGKAVSLKSALVNYNIDNLKYAAGLQQLGQGGSTGAAVPKFGTLNPGQLSGLRNELIKPVVDSRNSTHLGTDPSVVYNSWISALRSLSNGQWDPSTSPMVKQWADNLMKPYLAPWNAAHPNSHYGYVGGKLTRLTHGKGK